MLVEKTVKNGDVVTIKLTSGEELVAKLVDDGVMHYKLSRPVVLTMGQNGLGMAPYVFTVDLDTVIKLSKVNVTVMELTEPQAAEQYEKAVDTSRLKEVKDANSAKLGTPSTEATPEKA